MENLYSKEEIVKSIRACLISGSGHNPSLYGYISEEIWNCVVSPIVNKAIGLEFVRKCNEEKIESLENIIKSLKNS